MEPIISHEIIKITRNWDKGGMYFTITFEIEGEAATELGAWLDPPWGRPATTFNVNLWRDTSKPVEEGE
jgi:hypothetical protein